MLTNASAALLGPFLTLIDWCLDVIVLKVSLSYLNQAPHRIGGRNLYYSE